MHVHIVGAGVVGVTTAYYLALQGARVTVFERGDHVAGETSFANGGQLSYSFCDALASPGFLKTLPGLLAHRDIGARVRLGPRFLRWSLLFLAQCTRRRSDASTLATYRDALRSAELMTELREHTDVQFEFRRAGKMILLSREAQIRDAERSLALKKSLGCNNEILGFDDAASIEPGLRAFRRTPMAAVYAPDDEVGDARLFCESMKTWLQANTDTRFVLGAAASQLIRKRDSVHGVVVNGEEHEGDAVVVCAGVRSAAIAPEARLPIEPMRGYSITLPVGESPLSVSVTVLDRRFVFSRLGDRIRIAGFADFQGFSESGVDRRIRQLGDTACDVAPEVADYSAQNPGSWSNLRPMTPDSRPRVGATALHGLYTNTGHGMLGWTLACVSGEQLARCVIGKH